MDLKRRKRGNDTHGSSTDPGARLAACSNKAKAIPVYMEPVLMNSRSELAVDARLSLASGRAEREAPLDMLASLAGEHRERLDADKNYDTTGFVQTCREINVTPAGEAKHLRVWHQNRHACQT